MSCSHCLKDVMENEQLVTCEGFCCGNYHRKCAGLSLEDFICWNRNTLIWWMCSACSEMMNTLRQRDSLLAERERYEPEPERRVTESAIDVERTKPTIEDVMHELSVVKQQISQIQGNISTGPITGHERISESHVGTQASPLSSTRLQFGSRLDSSSGADGADRFWLFFTRVKNTVTEEQMLDMVRQSLHYTSNITPVVKKLTPYWKDESTMPYISFKIGIDPSMKTTAMLPSTWPTNICFREFYNRVWEPNDQL